MAGWRTSCGRLATRRLLPARFPARRPAPNTGCSTCSYSYVRRPPTRVELFMQLDRSTLRGCCRPAYDTALRHDQIAIAIVQQVAHSLFKGATHLYRATRPLKAAMRNASSLRQLDPRQARAESRVDGSSGGSK